jgi:uncharacterized protein (DUF2147 family)
LEIIMLNRNAASTFIMAALLAATTGSALAADGENYRNWKDQWSGA